MWRDSTETRPIPPPDGAYLPEPEASRRIRYLNNILR